MTNWVAVKAEYIAGYGSYRSICAKYGLTLSNLSRRAIKEHWPELRKEFQEKQLVDMEECMKIQCSIQIGKILDSTDKILDAIQQALDEVSLIQLHQKTTIKRCNYHENGKLKNQEITENVFMELASAIVDIRKVRQLTSALLNVAQILYPIYFPKHESKNPVLEIQLLAEEQRSNIHKIND